MRRKSLQAEKIETLITEALEGIKSNKYNSASEAARHLEISKTTLYRRLKGNPSRQTARIKQQLLTQVEENTLLKYIQQLTRGGYPITYALLRELAREVKTRRDGSGKSSIVSSDNKNTIGQDWVPRFVKRHPHIKSVIGRRIEVNRMDGTTKDALNTWFDEVERTIKQFKIDKSNIYNMDETGFSIGSMESTRVIVDTTIRTKWQANPGRQEWITVVECISADGTAMNPFVIFKGGNLSPKWYPQHLYKRWTFTSTLKGWTSNHHGLEWLEQVFDPSTRDRANGQTRLLICDGHGSHVTGGFISFCMENNIQLLVLPPHTSHILQPLDVAMFGPLKRALTTALAPFHEAQVKRIQKVDWVLAYEQARTASFTLVE